MNQMEYISRLHPEFPERLKYLKDCPAGLYVAGTLPGAAPFCVAIVGSRQCSGYGRRMAQMLGSWFGKSHIPVISGMADGIDGISQRAAIDAGGTSFGVLGCGVDICYPKKNWKLYEDLPKHGALISEYPPGITPRPAYFPQRNRIISGMADLVIVVEARKKSGSLITADCALEQGKDVYALPGPIDSELSEGCNRLIAQGAGILCSLEEFKKEINLRFQNVKFCENNENSLAIAENIVYSCLRLGPKSLDELTKECQLPVNQVMEMLIELEIQGLIQEISKHMFERR